MIKKLLAVLCFVGASSAFAQQNNSSPYSFYGVGDTKFKGTAENRSMGSIGVLTDSIHLNLQNPATYGRLKFANLAVGATSTKTKLQTETENSTAGRTSVDYIALALPFKKFGLAFGLMPYTSVGYRIQNTTEPYADDYRRNRYFEGTGGLNKVFGGFSYNLSRSFSLGAEFNYYFGKITTKSKVSINMAEYALQYDTRETNLSDYNGVTFNFGAYYQKLVNKKYTWTASAVFSPETSLNSVTNREISTVILTSSGVEQAADTYSKRLDAVNVKMPSKMSAGAGFGEMRKWFAGLEYTYTGSSVLQNRFDGVTDVKFENSYRVALGGYYIPKFYSFTSYLSRVTYRGGLRYETTGMVINNQSIKDMGVSLGVGLPLAGIGGTSLNLGVEYGKRGTKNAGLIQENYFNLFVGFSLNDRWFVKRKFE